jgi:uncharacterized damage-inducible protein DinB
MAETQRQPVPRNNGGELDTCLAFLSFARANVLKKAEGLDDEQLRRSTVDSGTSILGLVQHLTDGERYWFGHHLAGLGADDEEWDFSMAVPLDRASEQVLRDYREAVEASDAIVASIGDPDAPVARPVDDEPLAMRWVIAHMTSETVRHAGHADILREQIDGVTGR